MKLPIIISALLCCTAVQAQKIESDSKPYFTEYSFENLDDFPDYVLLFPKLSVLGATDFAKRRMVRNDDTFRLYPDEAIAFDVFRKRDLDSILLSRLRLILKTNQLIPELDGLIDQHLSKAGYSETLKDSVWKNLASAFFIVGSYQNPLERLSKTGLDSVVAGRLLAEKKIAPDAPRRLALDALLEHLYMWNRRLSSAHGAEFLDAVVLHRVAASLLGEKTSTDADDLSESMEIILDIRRLDDIAITIEKRSVIYYYEEDREEELPCLNNSLPSPKKKLTTR